MTEGDGCRVRMSYFVLLCVFVVAGGGSAVG
jgi:hypothetical protein